MNKSYIKFSPWNFMAVLISLALLPVMMNAQDNASFTDTRNGHVYNWTKIGTQTWMTENLNYNIPAGSWVYDNDSATGINFGKLFSWKAAQTACPKGWHLPSVKEWGTAIQTFGGNSEAGLKMQSLDTIGKSRDMAKKHTPAVGSSLLGGVRHADGTYTGINSWGGCWTTGKVNDTVASNVLFVKKSKEIGFSTNDKSAGFSVRCIRNK